MFTKRTGKNVMEILVCTKIISRAQNRRLVFDNTKNPMRMIGSGIVVVFSCPPDQLQPQGVPDPRRPQLPVHIRAARDPDCNSSRSPISRSQPQHRLRPDRKQPACVRSSSLSSSRFSLGGPVFTIY
ncbi:hypothetical protein DY000_02012939 [Brassica cretica]|uniref:Uncharacterized protein n=1 Tax=Brassica cretica TaxID=69181 RepID=A0ABQ7DAI4_BRACR|nr:hypothetical protein DY000_02012939 [Brassica cretica]